jgi:arabinose-5-phosphate isomerase
MLMHRDEDLPVVHVSAGMSEAVEEMSRKKLGMTCVVDDQGRLCGILTDGDLRRLMLVNTEPLSGTVDEAMIRTPVTIDPEALATAALKMMEDRKITSLPVVDSSGSLIGVVQIHDLWRTELF